MKKVHVVGDVHCKIEQFIDLIKDIPKDDIIVQVGDFGFEDDVLLFNHRYKGNNVFVVPGNHDFIPAKDSFPYVGDSYYIKAIDAFCIRGAFSKDKSKRLEGYDYFRNEELTYAEARDIEELYYDLKPSLVITHDAPASIIEGMFGYKDHSFTRTFFDHLLDIHAPDMWLFGHHHTSMSHIHHNQLTVFRCLNELEVKTLIR